MDAQGIALGVFSFHRATTAADNKFARTLSQSFFNKFRLNTTYLVTRYFHSLIK